MFSLHNININVKLEKLTAYHVLILYINDSDFFHCSKAQTDDKYTYISGCIRNPKYFQVPGEKSVKL